MPDWLPSSRPDWWSDAEDFFDEGPRDFIISRVAIWIIGIFLTGVLWFYELWLDVVDQLLRIPVILFSELGSAVSTFFGSVTDVILTGESLLVDMTAAAGPFSFIMLGIVGAFLLVSMSLLIRLVIRVFPFL